MRLAIVTQDPTNYGGVLRLVEYLYDRANVIGMEPTILHYARFAEHPELSVSLASLLRGEINVRLQSKAYNFRGRRAIAVGAWLPEWEPNRIRSSRMWEQLLSNFDRFILVTGSGHNGIPLTKTGKKFAAWVSSSVTADREERLRTSRNLRTVIERIGLRSVLKSEAHVLLKAERILAVSNDARKHLMELTPKTIEVFPFPVDTDRFYTAMERVSIPRFLFVGRANDPRKRVQLFLDSFAELQRRNPELKVSAVIVSNSYYSSQAIPNVEYRSGLSDEELIELYRSSTALVLTSEQEGLGIAAMEAMACGLPVISTRCGGTETFIEDNISGIFVNDHVSNIAEAMFILSTQLHLQQRMGKAARLRIESQFSENVWNNRFEDFLNTLPE